MPNIPVVVHFKYHENVVDFQKRSWKEHMYKKMMKGFVLGLKKKVLLRHHHRGIEEPTYEICEHRTQHTMNAFLQRL